MLLQPEAHFMRRNCTAPGGNGLRASNPEARQFQMERAIPLLQNGPLPNAVQPA